MVEPRPAELEEESLLLSSSGVRQVNAHSARQERTTEMACLQSKPMDVCFAIERQERVRNGRGCYADVTTSTNRAGGSGMPFLGGFGCLAVVAIKLSSAYEIKERNVPRKKY